MGQLVASAAKGAPFFTGASRFRLHDDASDRKVGGVYSHNPICGSATEIDEIVSALMFLILLGRTGATGLRVRNQTGAQIDKGSTVYVSGFLPVDETGDTGGQLATWVLAGVQDYDALYWKLTNAGTTRTVRLYSDPEMTLEVASGARTGDGSITLAQVNGSGISGSVAVTYTADDTDAGNILNLNLCLVTKADADDPNTLARYVLDTNLANNANGVAYGFRVVTGLDTSGAAAEGSLAFLSGTAGAVTYTELTGQNQTSQVVGVVWKKDAANGVMFFVPGMNWLRKFGKNYLQSGAMLLDDLGDVSAAAPETNAVLRWNGTAWIADPTAGTLTVSKTSDQTKNSDTAFANDSQLAVTLPGAGRYKINAIISVTTSNVPGIKYGLSGPTLTHMMVVVDQTYNFINELAGYTGGAYYAWHPGGSPDVGWIRLDGIVEVSAGGVLAFSWAQDVSDAANTTVKRGSFLSAEKV